MQGHRRATGTTNEEGQSMRRTILVALAALAVGATPAHADLGSPFAAGSAQCDGPGTGGVATGLETGTASIVSGEHPYPMLRITGSGIGGNADFGPFDYGVWETTWNAQEITYWRESGPLHDGERTFVGTDCGATVHPYRADVAWFDRPSAPAAYTGTGSSVIGFEVQDPGEFVVDVTPPPGASLRVGAENHHTGESGEYVSPIDAVGTYSEPATLSLGALAGGRYDLSVGGPGSSFARYLGPWQAVIRRLPGPSEAVPVLAAPPVSGAASPATPVTGSAAPATAADRTPRASTPSGEAVTVTIRRSGPERYVVSAVCHRTRCQTTLTVRSDRHVTVRKRTLQRGQAIVVVTHRGRRVRARALTTNLPRPEVRLAARG